MAVPVLLLTSVSTAATVILTFSGTYNTAPNSIFGESGGAVPFSFQITYNTALNTNTNVFLAGSQIGSHTAAMDLYGYSASGITASSLTFGNQTWDLAGIDTQEIEPGIIADFWLNADISMATPTASDVVFVTGNSVLVLGNAQGPPDSLLTTSSIDDGMGDQGFSTNMVISRIVVTPEPGAWILLSAGALGLFGWTRLRRGQCLV